jgi:hypothetical protein
MDSVAEKDFTSIQLKFPAFSLIVPRFPHRPTLQKLATYFTLSPKKPTYQQQPPKMNQKGLLIYPKTATPPSKE